MALATLQDVKRVSRFTDDNPERDAQLRGALDAVESWASTALWKISPSGPNVETYFDVWEDATLQLPGSDVTVTAIKIYEYPSSSGVMISPVALGLGHGYEVTDDGQLILRPLLGIQPFEGATAGRVPRLYSKIEVFFEGTGIVPRAVTDGIAFLAAGYWQDGPRALLGLTSERIGDYAYTLGDTKDAAGQPAFVARAMWLLRPFMKKSKVAVT